MKLRISDRICGALAGLALAFGAVAAVLRSVFSIHLLRIVSDWIATYIERGSFLWKACICVGAVLLLAIGVHCILMLFRHNGRKGSFVTQKTDAGEMSISIHAIERLVEQCAERYPETEVESIRLENLKDSLIIRMKIAMDSGINIPLTVGNLQRQVKQYVTDCSGVDVREVKVQIEPTAAKRGAPNNAPAAPAVERPAIQPVEEEPREEKIPLHQRIFGREEPKAEEPAAPEAPAVPEEVMPEEPAAEPVQSEGSPVQPEAEETAETVPEAGTEAAAEDPTEIENFAEEA